MSWWRSRHAVSRSDASVIRKEIEDGEGRLRQLPTIALDAARRATLSPEEIEFFDLFSWFAVALESSISESWTVDPVYVQYVRHPAMPIFGRRFIVFYNKIEMGTLDVSPTADVFNAREHGVDAVLRLRHLNFVPFEDAYNLVANIELYCGPFETRESSWARAGGAATAALTGYLWDVVRADTTETTTLFEHHCSGPYTGFRESVAHWTKNNVTPEKLVEWRYNRERYV